MAPVQTFSSSPITAAKAPEATPQAQASPSKATPASAAAAAQPTSASLVGPPVAAQPAARPSIPTFTSGRPPPPQQPPPSTTAAPGVVTAGEYQQATPTQPFQQAGDGPPAPQPGAVPAPPGRRTSTLPAPPKVGETLRPELTGAPPSAAAVTAASHVGGYPAPMTMPLQMGYEPPMTSHSIQGTSTAPGFGESPPVSNRLARPPVGGLAAQLPINQATDMSHPPGYQQDVHAAEFSTGQRAAHNAYVAQQSGYAGGESTGESIWNAAKKWASAAGDTLAAAEGEVWKAVNKDQK